MVIDGVVVVSQDFGQCQQYRFGGHFSGGVNSSLSCSPLSGLIPTSVKSTMRARSCTTFGGGNITTMLRDKKATAGLKALKGAVKGDEGRFCYVGIHAHTHIHARARTHARTHTCTHKLARARAHTHTHTHTHITHTHTHARTRTHARTHTHTRTQ